MTEKFADDGLLIEAGWESLKAIMLQLQVSEMRKAFFAGAQHLFSSIMGVSTQKDLHRLEMISVELEAFVDELKREARGI